MENLTNRNQSCGESEMNAKQKTARASKMSKQNAVLRERYWPEVTDEQLWLRKNKTGFTTIPRCLPQIMAIIDALTKNTPASKTYFALWCRSFDEMVIRIPHPMILAAESGFSGSRQLTTWQNRMALLNQYGFIKTAKGQAGDYEFVILLNPFMVIQNLKGTAQWTSSMTALYHALAMRAEEVGANDLDTAGETA